MFVAKFPGSTYATAAMNAGPRNGQAPPKPRRPPPGAPPPPPPPARRHPGPRPGGAPRKPRRRPASDSSAASSTRASPGRTSSSGWTSAVRSWSRGGASPRHHRGAVSPECGELSLSGHDAVDLEALGVLAVHVHAVHAGEVPDVLGVGVAPVLLRGVPGERGDLALQVPL